MNWLARELADLDRFDKAADALTAVSWVGAPPPGKLWEWDTVKGSWALVDDPSAAAALALPAARPLVRADGNPFHLPVRRSKGTAG